MKSLRIFLISGLLFLSGMACAQDFDTAAEQELVRQVNEERSKQGAPPVQPDAQLQSAARAHTRLLVEHRALSHQFAGEPELAQRLAQSGVTSDRAAENVAFDQDAASAHRSLMHSPGHRANILNPAYNAIGVGAIESNGSLYVTEDFARTMAAEAPSAAEKTIAAEIATARARAGLPALPQRAVAQVRALACRMAKKETLDAPAALQLPQVRSVVAYTATQLTELSGRARSAISSGTASGYALGACFARNRQFPGGAYYVVLVIFGPAE
jgi:hypothetical protein